MSFSLRADAEILGAENLPANHTLEGFVAGVMNQGNLGSCVGHARAAGITLVSRIKGLLGWEVSPDGIYRLARCVERAASLLPGQPLPKLTDTGAYPSCAHIAVSSWGVSPFGERSPDGRYSDCWEGTVNEEPDLFTLETTKLIVGEHAIAGLSADRGLGVRRSIYLGAPVECGSFVDTRYMDWVPEHGAYAKPDYFDPDGGGHDQLIVGYIYQESIKAYWYRVLNSWGTGWGDSGYSWVTEEFLAQCDDLNSLSVQVGER